MKAWKLTAAREYKHYSSDEINIDCNTHIDCQVLDVTNPELIKVKMVKSNLSVIDIDYYNTSCLAPSQPITPSRSALALVSESHATDFEIGRRIFLSPYSHDVKGNIQTRSYDIDGYLSDFAIVSTSEIYHIPEGMPDNDVLFVEDVAIAVSALNKLHLSKGEYIVLQGASHLNCILAQLAIYYQAIPIVIDNDEDRLAVAQNLGVYYTIDTNVENVLRKIIEITSGKMVDALAVDADSFPCIDELNILKRCATICVYGYKKADIDLNAALNTLLHNALTIVGVDNGQNDIRSAINLIANKVLNFDNLIETETPFNNLVQIMKTVSGKINPYKHIITFI